MKCNECDFNRNGFCESYDGTVMAIEDENQDCIYMSNKQHTSKCPYCGTEVKWCSYLHSTIDCTSCGRPFNLEVCKI